MSVIKLTIGGTTKRSTLGQHEAELDWDTMPEAAKDFIIRYGLKQYLADGMAGAANEADAKAGVEARVAKLKSGDLSRVRGEGKAVVDSVEARALKLAKATIRTTAKAKNMTVTKEQVDAAAKALVESQPKWKEDAKAQLDTEATMGDALDLKALGLA